MRGWVRHWKLSRILRVPAGDPPDEHDCECGGCFLLTEAGEPITTELTEALSPENCDVETIPDLVENYLLTQANEPIATQVPELLTPDI